MSKTHELLTMYRDLTKRTGILHEWQVKQLKLWPYVLFDIKSHDILPDDRCRVISFNVYAETALSDHTKFAELETWVQHLLGKEWAVRIRDASTGTMLYKGDRGVLWLPPDDTEELTFEDYEREQHGSDDSVEQ